MSRLTPEQEMFERDRWAERRQQDIDFRKAHPEHYPAPGALDKSDSVQGALDEIHDAQEIKRFGSSSFGEDSDPQDGCEEFCACPRGMCMANLGVDRSGS